MMNRHGLSCFKYSLGATMMYRWYMYDKKYWCLICGTPFRDCTKMAAHYLDHDESDVNVFGMTRFMLGRSTPEKAEK